MWHVFIRYSWRALVVFWFGLEQVCPDRGPWPHLSVTYTQWKIPVRFRRLSVQLVVIFTRSAGKPAYSTCSGFMKSMRGSGGRGDTPVLDAEIPTSRSVVFLMDF